MNFFKSSKKTNDDSSDEDIDPAQIRKALFEQISESDYNKTDIDRLKKEDFTVTRYFKEDTQSTIDTIKSVLEWRKSYELSDIKEEDFPEDLQKTTTFVRYGHDVENNVMVYIRVKLFVKDRHPMELFKKHLAFLLDQVDRETHGDGWVLCFDCTDSGPSNVDMELIKLTVQCLTLFYLENCRYVLIYEMPWALASVWKLVSTWLPQDQREGIKFATKKDFGNFVEESQQPDFIKESE